ncbi:MAG TPA: penicillin acylase family protein [Candidatus Acidoferrum sp.]
MRTLFRLLFVLLCILAIAASVTLWYFIYRPLPQLDSTLDLPGLQKDVIVERDHWGVPHIRAGSVEDMVEAQGYVMAQDRLWQMDLLRRVGRGQLSEILGPATINIDKQFRTLGFSRAAERDYSLVDPATRAVFEAYARGVNHFIEQHSDQLPLEFTLLKYKPTPWLPTDSLVISGYMYETLTDTWEEEIDRAKVTDKVGFDRARELFSPDAGMDHYVVGDPNVANDGSQRSHVVPDGDDDDDDDDDMESDGVLKANNIVTPDANLSNATEAPPDLTTALANSVTAYIEDSRREIRHSLGSNNWVVSGAHTATGKPILANDTHLELSIPPIWYEMHLTAPGWNVKGMTLPGAPLVVIGHNDHIAWGFTNNGADVQDLYIETFNPANADEYLVNKKWVKAQTFDEIIKVKGQPDQHLPIVVTRHGPIVRCENGKSYSLRWTATEPGGLSNVYNWLGKAQNWEEFRSIIKHVWGPAQNAVYADTQGNIGYVMSARVPIRKKGHGEIPQLGDTDDYEWIGYIPFDQLPQALNPDSGLIATANARVVGPAYKPYLTDRWEEPYRTARIYDLLLDKHDLRPTDMLKVEIDTYSYPHVFLADQLIAAAKTATPQDDRTKKLIEGLKDWNGIADADSSEVSFLVQLRRSALSLLLEPYLGSETNLYRWRSTTFLQKILTDRPSKWLPAPYKSYDALLIAAADRTVAKLASDSKSQRIEDWQWKNFNALEMLHPIGREGLLKKFLSITGKPQSGTNYSVRAATPHHGPAMRFIANTANWDESILLIPAGQSGQPGSSHYSDQFEYWYEGKPIYAPFSDPAELQDRKHTLTLRASR